jgi:hypothetical protein
LRAGAVVLIVSLALGLSMHAAGSASDPAETAGRLRVERQKDALRFLEDAARAGLEGNAADFRRLLIEVAQRLDALGSDPSVPRDLARELKARSAELLKRAESPPEGFSADTARGLLDRLAAALQTRRVGLDFQGGYSQTKVKEPVYGGHASAMGPPPVAAPQNATASPSPVRFEEIPGLTVKTYCGGATKDHLIESGGSGIALVDYDNDGLLDIYVVNAFELDAERRPIPHRNALYRNLGGWRFEEVGKRAGVDAALWGNGVCAGDFDGDGLIDLYVTNWGKNLLYRNNGDGTFTDVASAAGVEAGGWSTGCAFVDTRGTGRLDLYVARYATVTWDEVTAAKRTMTWRGGPKVMAGPVGLPGAADIFFENKGDGTFADATDARGLSDKAGSYGFGVVATDYDGDGWPDLFVANDSGPNFLYRNRGNGNFESVGLLAGVALNGEARAQAGMGVDAGDYDNDGFLDFVLTTFAHDVKTLYRNLGNGQFEDATQGVGLAAPTFQPMGWGTAFFDADLDGALDLFIANGHIYAQVDEFPDLNETYRQKNQFFLNEAGHFRDVSETAGAGLQVRKSSRGLAVGDLDNDGDPDLVISNVDDVPTLLENRQRTGHHWAGFRLQKDGPNPFCIGARVTLEASGRRQIREVRSGGGYLSQNDLRVLFGLGDYRGPVNVEVRLGQQSWHFGNLSADRYQTLALGPEGAQNVYRR